MKVFCPVLLAVLCILVSGGNCRSVSHAKMKSRRGNALAVAETSEYLLDKMPEQLKTVTENIHEQLSNAKLEQETQMEEANYHGKENGEEAMTRTEEEPVDRTLPSKAEKPVDKALPAKAWANTFDEDMHYECARNGAIQKVESEHSWAREDRRWLFECIDILPSASASSCAWTKDTEVNEFDHPFYYECPLNHYLAGVASIHSHKKEDRQWSYKCCGSEMVTTDSCVLSEFVNWFGGAVSYSAPEGHVLVGAGSINKNRMEDRIWKFSTCRYTSN